MKSKWETAHRNPFEDLMKWHDSILESQKRKEKIMKSKYILLSFFGICLVQWVVLSGWILDSEKIIKV